MMGRRVKINTIRNHSQMISNSGKGRPETRVNNKDRGGVLRRKPHTINRSRIIHSAAVDV